MACTSIPPWGGPMTGNIFVGPVTDLDERPICWNWTRLHMTVTNFASNTAATYHFIRVYDASHGLIYQIPDFVVSLGTSVPVVFSSPEQILDTSNARYLHFYGYPSTAGNTTQEATIQVDFYEGPATDAVAIPARLATIVG